MWKKWVIYKVLILIVFYGPKSQWVKKWVIEKVGKKVGSRWVEQLYRYKQFTDKRRVENVNALPGTGPINEP
ncbi:hypothetical protein ACWWJF_27340 [Symbiopectobacterium sp. Eva_TO]